MNYEGEKAQGRSQYIGNRCIEPGPSGTLTNARNSQLPWEHGERGSCALLTLLAPFDRCSRIDLLSDSVQIYHTRDHHLYSRGDRRVAALVHCGYELLPATQ